MPKELFDDDGNLFTATKKLKIFESDNGGITWDRVYVVVHLKDTDAVVKATDLLKADCTKDGLKYGVDYKFEVEDV